VVEGHITALICTAFDKDNADTHLVGGSDDIPRPRNALNLLMRQDVLRDSCFGAGGCRRVMVRGPHRRFRRLGVCEVGGFNAATDLVTLSNHPLALL
jgi:hypothetical protein